MGSHARTNRAQVFQPRAGSPEAVILQCVNLPGGEAFSIGELVTILSAPGMSGWEHMLARLFGEIHPRVLLTFFPPRGVDVTALVGAYERAKTATGQRSDAFEKSLAGQFVFTS